VSGEQGGVGTTHDFWPIIDYNSQTVRDTAMVTVEHAWETTGTKSKYVVTDNFE